MVLIIPKRLINDSGWTPILFGSFLGLQQTDQTWAPGPFTITKTFHEIQEKHNTILKHIILHITTFRKSKQSKMLDTTGHQQVEHYL